MSAYVNILVLLLVIKYVLNQWPELTRKRNEMIFLVLSSIVLTFFTGLREQYMGADTQTYIRIFDNYRRYDTIKEILSLNVKNNEYGFALLTWIIGRFTDNANIFFTIIAGFFSYSLARFIYKNSKNYYFSIILYYTVGMFGFQMTGIRQAISMAILLFSIEFIKERKLAKFLLVVWVATWFHRSALAFLFAYPFSRIKINLKNMTISIFAVSAIIFLNEEIVKFANKFLGYKFETYLGFSQGGIVVIIMYILTLIIGYIFNDNLHKQSKYNMIFYNITLYSLAIYTLRYFMQIAERVSFYYHFAFIILLPNIVEAIPDRKTKRVIYISAVVLSCSLFFYRYQIKPMLKF